MNKIIIFLFFLFLSNQFFAQSGDPVFISKSLFIPKEKMITHKIGDKIIPINLIQFGDTKDFICINLHANEISSVAAAMKVLEETGGTLIKIENNRQRVIKFRLNGISYGFDPNRMFSRIGIEQTLRENRNISPGAINEIEKFAQRVLQLIADSAECVIALHNNTDEAYSVKSYLLGSDRQKDAKAVYADSTQDVDDIVFTTDSLIYQRMAAFGFNSIWQDNEKVKKDGSLSVYYGEKNKRYVNIETQHGKVDQYIVMLEKLLLVLSDESKRIQAPAEEKQSSDQNVGQKNSPD